MIYKSTKTIETTDDGLFAYSYLDNGHINIECVIKKCDSVIIPASINNTKVDSVSERAFAASARLNGEINYIGMKSVIFEDGILKIGDYAFADNSYIENVVLPKGLCEIGAGFFRCCDKLKYVHMPNTVIAIGREAFYECKELEQIEFSHDLETIGFEAFRFCKKLSTADFRNTQIKEIGELCFDYTGVMDVYLPESIVNLNLGFKYWSGTGRNMYWKYNHCFDRCDGIKIHAYSGGVAEEFAKKCRLEFVAY